MSTLKKNNLVQKSNLLNEIRANNMSLTELRFFSIYLSKINKNKPEETRVVRFAIADFRAIMELGLKIRYDYMKSVTDRLLCKVVNIPDGHGGYDGFQLFKNCKVSVDDFGEWYVEIDAHDRALPLMFEFKNKYFSYKLWNALRLRSVNQLRMYEILKQYQKIGHRILSIDDLKEFLGIDKEEYPRYGDFKSSVLNVCQKALAEHTDIKFSYEPHGKKGRGGKIFALKFTIENNEGFTDQLTLDMFIEQNIQDDYGDFPDGEDGAGNPYQERIDLFKDACGGEFSNDEVEVLQGKMRNSLSDAEFQDQIYCYHYINDRYNLMEMQSKRRNIANRFGYMKSLMSKEI